MALETAYYSASGPAFSDCYFLAQRYDSDAGYKPYDAECWVCGVKPSGRAEMPYNMTSYHGTTAWLTGLWRSPSGRVFVSDAEGKIRLNASLDTNHGKGQWQVTELRDALFGIWGLDDSNIFAWGSRIKDHPVYRFDGTSWSEIANPGFQIDSMHGLSPDLLYAVGHDGGIARFDGKSWQRFPGPVGEQLTTVGS